MELEGEGETFTPQASHISITIADSSVTGHHLRSIGNLASAASRQNLDLESERRNNHDLELI